jgi:RIO kinase 2
MQLLHQNKFPTPKPIDTNRHATVMSLIDGDAMCHIQRISTQEEIKRLFEMALEMVIRFAKNGLIHSDYNEFNLMVN